MRLEVRALHAFEGTLREMESAAQADRSAERRQMEIAALEMRMAALAGRMTAPKKGDRPEKLGAEYDALAAQLRNLKQSPR